MSKFKVGEIVTLSTITGRFQPIEVEIISCIGLAYDEHGRCNYGYIVSPDPDNDGRPWSELCLKKLPPKDDPTTWNECVWKPTEIKESS